MNNYNDINVNPPAKGMFFKESVNIDKINVELM